MADINDTIEDLQAALAGLESGDGPYPFLAGHGIQSRLFRFRWGDDALSVDIDLPWGRVMSDEESQRDDDAEAGAACRMAMLLLAARRDGTLLCDGEARLSASCGEDGPHYSISDAEGNVVDEGDDWSVLASRLETAFGGCGMSEGLSFIRP